MSERDRLSGMTREQAVEYAMNNDLSDLMAEAEVIRERRPAKMVTALRIDMETQAALEAAAAERGIGSSTLMRQIMEEWVHAHRNTGAADQVEELVYHLDAARNAANSLRQAA
jgi:predicted DNA-binding protein